MTTEAALDHLKRQFSSAVLTESHFLGETTVAVDKVQIKELLTSLRDEQGYAILTDLSGIDYLSPTKHTCIFYLLQNPSNDERIRLTVTVEREESLPSITTLWKAADWFERELYDLFGVHFEGHPDIKRILMPDDWIGHPLRRDYALTEEPVAFKHGVEPKIPSQTIPFIPYEKKNKKF